MRILGTCYGSKRDLTGALMGGFRQVVGNRIHVPRSYREIQVGTRRRIGLKGPYPSERLPIPMFFGNVRERVRERVKKGTCYAL